MFKKIIKKYVPATLWKYLRLGKTLIARIKFQRATNEPAYLEYEKIKDLIGSFPAIAEYNYDEKSCQKRGQERAVFLTKIFPNTDTKKKILELGCSDAMTSVALEKIGFNPIALDIVDQRLEVAKNEKIQFIKSSAEKIPLDDNSVDFVFSYNAMEHFNDPKKVLTEIYRILKPGGYFYADFDPLYYSPRGLHAYRKINIPYLQIIFKALDLKKYADQHGLNWSELPFVNAYTKNQFNSIWKSMDFEIKKYEEIIDISGLSLIKKYPSCFKKESLTFEDFIISGIRILLRKK